MSASQCSSCDAPLREEAKYCTQCGAVVAATGDRTIMPVPPGFAPRDREIIPVPPGFETDRDHSSEHGPDPTVVGAEAGQTSPPPPTSTAPERVISPVPPEWETSEPASIPDPPSADRDLARRRRPRSGIGVASTLLANPSAIIIGVPLIIMSVLFVWKVVLNQSTAGASSPQAVVNRLVDGARQQDVLGLANTVAPSESMNLADIAQTTFDSLNDADLTNTESTSVEVDIDSVDVDQVNDSVALVSVDFSAEITSTSAWFRAAAGSDSDDYTLSAEDVLDALNSRFASGSTRAESLTLVAVKEDGGWFWSPILTSVFYVDTYVDDIDADWDAVERVPEATANTSPEAFENAIAAIRAYDVQALAASTDTAAARALMVIDDGLQALLDDPDVRSFEIDIEPTYEDSGATLELNHLDVSVSDSFDSTSASLSSWCARLDGSDTTTCIDYPWLDPMDPSPMISTANERGGVVVDVFATIRHQADLISANSSLNRLLGLWDYPWLAKRLRTTPGSTATVDFGDEPFALLAVPVDQGQIPAISFDATNATRYMFEDASGELSLTRRDGEAGTWLLAVYTEGAFCARTLCDWVPGGETTVQVDNAYVQPVQTSTSADAELAPGGAYVFEIAVPDGVSELDITVDGNVTSSVDDTAPGVVTDMGRQTQWTVTTGDATTYYLSVANPGVKAENLHVEVRVS